MRKPALALAAAAVAAVAAVTVAGCGGSGASGAAVPSLAAQAGQGQGQAGQGQGQAGQADRASALHAAAECIRQHGIPRYADPVLTPGGQVYSDLRPIQDAGDAAIAAVQQACGTLMARAGLDPQNEPPAPPQLVQAGVRSSECLRAHGLPNVKDPTAQTPYTPGHGFGFTRDEIPAGGKADPAFQQATHACRAILDAEIRASTLASLGNDG
ncbi:MAG TPA: hypothetical protein VKU39_11585 [Streptosporangiaceae bacterium]|nr:hypothetical protein [Streptosporangiaceae bacterium]